MTDLISRQAAIEALGEKPYPDGVLSKFEFGKKVQYTADKEAIEAVPIIDPVKHGKWEHGREITRTMLADDVLSIDYEDWKCSNCGCTVEDEKPSWKYCPKCGAKMDGGEIHDHYNCTGCGFMSTCTDEEAQQCLKPHISQ